MKIDQLTADCDANVAQVVCQVGEGSGKNHLVELSISTACYSSELNSSWSYLLRFIAEIYLGSFLIICSYSHPVITGMINLPIVGGAVNVSSFVEIVHKNKLTSNYITGENFGNGIPPTVTVNGQECSGCVAETHETIFCSFCPGSIDQSSSGSIVVIVDSLASNNYTFVYGTKDLFLF